MPSRASSSSRISSPSGFRSGSRNRSTDSSRSSRRRSSGSAASVAQPAELLLAQRRAGLGDQPGDRHDPRGELADPAVGARSAPATARAESRASGRAAPISSARDRTTIALIGEAWATERSMNASRNWASDAVEVAHQVEDRVGLAGPVAVVVEQGLLRPLRGAARRPRRGPGVSISVRSASFADGQPTSIRSTASMSSSPRSISRAPSWRRKARSRVPARPELGDHPVAEGVAVPGHDPGALAGVGRRQPLADQRVEQGRLAGLDPARDRDPERFVEPPLGDPSTASSWSVPRATSSASAAMRRTSVARSPRPDGHVHVAATAGPRSCRCSGSTEWSALATRMHIWVAPAGLSLTL